MPPPNSMSRLAHLPLYPIILAAWLVLAVQVDTGVHLLATPRVWAVALVGSAAALGFWLVLLRRVHLAGFAAGATVLLASASDLGRVGLGVVLVAAVVAALFVVQRIVRHRIALVDVTWGFNVLGAILVAVAFLTGVANGVIPATVKDLLQSPRPAGAAENASAPDVYVVLMDGYPRADVLEQVAGMDNAPFLRELMERGFRVAEDSRSSYMYTDLTITSMLHGRHLVDIPELAPLLRGESRPALGRQVLNDAPLLERLRELGYVTIANAPAWEEPALRNVDVYLEASGVNEFERQMLWNSLPGSLWELRGPVVYQEAMAPWVDDAFAAWKEAAVMELEGPRFAFIHVPIPHFPVIFEPDGTRADGRFGLDHPAIIDAPEAEVREAYAGQVSYLNDRVLATLDGLDLPADATLILTSDHGPEFGLDWDDPEATDLPTRFGAFLAARSAIVGEGVGPNVSEVLLSLMRALGYSDEPMEERYFISEAVDKWTTLREVADPWESE